MKNLATAKVIEEMLSKLEATRFGDDEQALFDYPSQKANPHLHFVFDSAEIGLATQVTVTVVGRANNFKNENGMIFDLHLTPLGVFPLDGFVNFLEGLLSASID